MVGNTTLELICLWNGESKGTKNNIIQALGRLMFIATYLKILEITVMFWAMLMSLGSCVGGNLNFIMFDLICSLAIAVLMNNMPKLTAICPRTKREFTIEKGSEEFILKVVSLENNAFRLDLYQQGFRLAGRKERPPAIQISSMQGQALVLSMGSIYRILSDCGYKKINIPHRRKHLTTSMVYWDY